MRSAAAGFTSQHQVTAVRVDAGGGLPGALLRAGLADGISVVIGPFPAADTAGVSPHLITGTDSPALAVTLTHTERLRNGHIWLRYAVNYPAYKVRQVSTKPLAGESPGMDR